MDTILQKNKILKKIKKYCKNCTFERWEYIQTLCMPKKKNNDNKTMKLKEKNDTVLTHVFILFWALIVHEATINIFIFLRIFKNVSHMFDIKFRYANSDSEFQNWTLEVQQRS